MCVSRNPVLAKWPEHPVTNNALGTGNRKTCNAQLCSVHSCGLLQTLAPNGVWATAS